MKCNHQIQKGNVRNFISNSFIQFKRNKSINNFILTAFIRKINVLPFFSNYLKVDIPNLISNTFNRCTTLILLIVLLQIKVMRYIPFLTNNNKTFKNLSIILGNLMQLYLKSFRKSFFYRPFNRLAKHFKIHRFFHITSFLISLCCYDYVF